ncbi:MAG: glycosyltransferase [Methanobacteriota archaeon]
MEKKKLLTRFMAPNDVVNNDINKLLAPWIHDRKFLVGSFRLDARSKETTLDGVSEESDKLAFILHSLGGIPFYYSGQTLAPNFIPPEHQFTNPTAHFKSAERGMSNITRRAFRDGEISEKDEKRIRRLAAKMQPDIVAKMRENDIDCVIGENTCFPVNMAFSLALIQAANECGLPFLGHYHDFAWERPDKYTPQAGAVRLPALLREISFGADRLSIGVINKSQGRWVKKQLELMGRDNVAVGLWPNVMNFREPPAIPRDEEVERFYNHFGLTGEDVLVVIPLRVVPRKDIPRGIALAGLLHEEIKNEGYGYRTVKVLLTHEAGDEGKQEIRKIRALAKKTPGVELLEGGGLFTPGDEFGLGSAYTIRDAGGKKIYPGGQLFSLGTAYKRADAVIIPSKKEGFCNAVMEAVYFGIPNVAVAKFGAYISEIQPRGFRFIELGQDVHADEYAAKQMIELMQDPELQTLNSKHNYDIGLEHFSFNWLKHQMLPLFENFRFPAPSVHTRRKSQIN